MTAAEAFFLHVTKRGLDGDGWAARAALTAIEDARASRGPGPETPVPVLTIAFVWPGSINTAMRFLRMATKLDRLCSTARMALEPWLVEAALAQLGARRLTLMEQAEVRRATRMPHKVRWPDWWGAEC